MKKYVLTTHAIQRVSERLGIHEGDKAANHINQIMQTAYFAGECPHKSGTKVKVYDHHKSKTRILIDREDKVVTVYRFTHALFLPDAFQEEVMALVTRRFKAMESEHKRKQRAIEIELAEFNLEKAQLELNKIKAKSPKIQTQIQAKVDEIMTKVKRLEFELSENEQAFKQATSGIDLLVAQ